MSQSGQTPNQNRITDLKVSGHLMTLDQGLFCVFHVPAQEPPSPRGLPGVRLTQPPLSNSSLTISTFDDTGWLGGSNNAALIRVTQGPAQVLVTVYQEPGSPHDAPRLQVVRLSDATAQSATAADATMQAARLAAAQPGQQAAQASAQFDPNNLPEVAAHIQRRGDVGARLGEWMGTPGSRAWIEGFGIAPTGPISAADIEYQAVLGKGWLSPWTEGGQYCGSRGMALPILGLRVRLKGKAAEDYLCEVEATFTDGTTIGPIGEDETAEAESLAPLEAFRVTIVSRDGAAALEAAEEFEEELGDDLALLDEVTDLVEAAERRAPRGAAKRPRVVTKAAAATKPATKKAAAAPTPKKAAPKTTAPRGKAQRSTTTARGGRKARR
ncbi:hypothetical protein AA0472_1971 [Acetobacter estunensis NRIC 0472]|uniref:Hydrophobic W protein n=1 Tax=Acetobacter estunensis TaxID=104097 RepID=A0A967B409_9PROT|nr:hypothetical protein [Acetobacter estunensis]NHO52455.1 hypothetical protein [Acetobacter estunensis]GBQ26030.1 hypothetical protein AA0472_1971 [Acetobacter estunensis NRIC 0472]